MRLFLLFFLTVYTGMNLYVFRKLYLLRPGRRWYFVLLAVAAAVLGAAPIVTRLLDHHAEWSGVGRALVMAGNVWLALVFWLSCVRMGFGAWNLLARLLSAAAPSAGRVVLHERSATVASLVVVVGMAALGLHEAGNVRLKELRLNTPRLPAGSAQIRIVQISDTHLHFLRGRRLLQKVSSLTEQARPDLIVLTGDAVDMPFEYSRSLAPLLAGLKAPLGKFAVTGNHEYYVGLEEAEKFFGASGFLTLHDSTSPAGDRLLVAGVDDSSSAYFPEDVMLPAARDGRFVLLLKHRPLVSESALGRFDLQLSGHIHGGQIFPFSIFANLAHRYGPGVHDLGQGSHLYVSRGAGTWGPPLRFLAPPEVTLIVIEPMQ